MTGRPKLFVYNYAHNGDIVFSRPLYRRLLDADCFELLFAGARNTAYLMEDLVGPHSRLLVCDYADVGNGVTLDPAYALPDDHLPVHTWLGRYPDTHNHQWVNVVTVFNRQMEELGLAFRVPYDPTEIPVVDFAARRIGPAVRGKAIYLDNSFARGRHSDFLFDLAEMAAAFPDHLLLCTARPEVRAANLVDCSGLDLIELSHLSDQCEVILGKASGPFCCTYTTANRFKPRAVCGYHSIESPTFWDYPNSPIRHLDTMEQVLDFTDQATRCHALTT
ncbi:MAG: hypothetical protein KDC87_18255 [Planctomycetes bacterium]|nr:hypothetical protein [Planctomycetota bacterium]